MYNFQVTQYFLMFLVLLRLYLSIYNTLFNQKYVVNNLLLVALGGAMGASLRYLVGGWVQQYSAKFPLGTLAVNIIGSFIIAIVLFGAELKGYFSEEMRIFLAIGILGSFTTMSSFNYETFRLIDQHQSLLAFLNIIANFVGGILAVFVGRALVLTSGG